MIKPYKIASFSCALFLCACSQPEDVVDAEDRLDMASVKQFVSNTKESDKHPMEPLPDMKPARDLQKLTYEPFRLIAPLVKEDWHKYGSELKGKGRSSR